MIKGEEMAFKINTQATLNPPTPSKPKPQESTPQTPTSTPNTQTPTKSPIGNLSSTLPPSSNSAFSSLFLSQKEWLDKEFGINEETFGEIQDLLEESRQERYLADFLWDFKKI